MRRQTPRLTIDDYVALGVFRTALRRFQAFSEAGARAEGLTSQQHQALLAIRAHPGPEPMSIGELAECLMIKNHSAVGLVSRLQARDLVRRRVSAGDRRRVLLAITPQAERSLATISRGNLAELKSSADAIRQLLEALQRLDERTTGSGG
ncbi:MAG TPA: MarR family transcriptional regulator [Phenylobacterium sp.]|jgi:DNA-binding MarR family transcriptional regulator|nr:MarR family transcriptional regulator [Phenylobacterium sp.]